MGIIIDKFSKYFDHTLLKADATDKEISILCDEAVKNNFKSVAINSCRTKFCKNILKSTDILVAATVAFPLGQTSLDVKLFETENAVNFGADEIDYVITISALKDKNYTLLEKEMKKITELCHQNGTKVKAIFEICLLTDNEIKAMCKIANEYKPDFIKTSTGFSKSGATIDAVAIMRAEAIPEISIKAAGGIRSFETALKMINAGASRIGSSASVAILKEYSEQLK